MEGRAEVAGILLERRRHQDQGLLVLQRALAFQKVKELSVAMYVFPFTMVKITDFRLARLLRTPAMISVRM